MPTYNDHILERALKEYEEALAKKDGRFITIDEWDQVHFKGIPLGLYATRTEEKRH